MNKRSFATQAGFTMIELILTLILAGMTAAMITPLFQSGITSSSTPIYRLESVAQLETTMANIIAAVRAPGDENDDTVQNPYQTVGSGMDALARDINNEATFSQWVPSGASITATCNGPFRLGTKTDPAIETIYDPNQVLEVTLKSSDGESLTYIFSEGTNYVTTPDALTGGGS